MLDFVIYLCSHGETKDPTIRCIFNLIGNIDYKFKVYWQPPDASLGHARSVACWDFLRNNVSNKLVFLDTDHVFGPDDMAELVKSMDEYDIIAGAYPMAGKSGLAIHPWEDIVWDGHIEEIKYASAGFMGITRKALKQIKTELDLPLLNKGEWCECYPFFELKSCPEEGCYLSEDWEFCNKARAARLKVYIHTGILVGHIKERVIYAQPNENGKLEIKG